MPGSEGTFTLKSFNMKRILLYLLFILACLNSCTTTREIRHQVMVHDTLRLNHRDTLRQWSIQHDSVYLRDSIYWQGNQMVKERLREHWHLQHDTLHSTRVDTLYRSKVQQQTEHTTTQNKTGNRWANALRFLLLGVILGAILMAMKSWK